MYTGPLAAVHYICVERRCTTVMLVSILPSAFLANMVRVTAGAITFTGGDRRAASCTRCRMVHDLVAWCSFFGWTRFWLACCLTAAPTSGPA